jgi:hypothetical protein
VHMPQAWRRGHVRAGQRATLPLTGCSLLAVVVVVVVVAGM